MSESSRTPFPPMPPACSTGATFPGEEWRPVVGWPAYEVSDNGRVRRVAPGRGTWAGRILKPGRDTKGYPIVALAGDERPRPVTKKVHGLTARAFIGERPPGFQVNHIDGDKQNGAVSNLEYLSPKDNSAHARRLGLWRPAFGKGKPIKLNAEAVKVIRFMNAKGVPQWLLAGLYGIHQVTASEVVTRKIWARVP